MAIFELDDGHGALVQPMRPTADAFDADAAALLGDQVTTLLGDQVLTVRRGGRGGGPHLLALDPAGQPVVVEVHQRLDRDGLLRALRNAGGASRLSRADLARMYEGGPEKFEADLAVFRDRAPLVRPQPDRPAGVRLVVVCADVEEGLADAVAFVTADPRVEVLRLGVTHGPGGRRYVEVSAVHGAAARERRPVEPLVTTGVVPVAVGAPEPGSVRLAQEPEPATEAPATEAPAAEEPAPEAAEDLAPEAPEPEGGEAVASAPTPGRTSGSTGRMVSEPAATTEPTPVQAPPAGEPATVEVQEGQAPAFEPRAAAEPEAGQPEPSEDDAPAATPEPGAAEPGATEPGPAAAVADRTDPSPAYPTALSAAAPSRRDRRHRAPAADEPSAASATPAGPSDETTLLPAIEVQDAPAPASPSAPRPELAALAAAEGAPVELVWLRVRRGQRLVATLRDDGLLELPDGSVHADPDAAATAAADLEQPADGWRVWRFGDHGRSLGEVVGIR